MQFQGHQYETVSGFVCEAFGYIPRTGECIKVVLEREDEDDNNESSADQQDQKEKNQTFKLEVINRLPSKIVTCWIFAYICPELERMDGEHISYSNKYNASITRL